MVFELRDKKDLDELFKRSHNAPVLVFKHSTQCGRSEVALEELHDFLRDHSDIECGIVDVLEHRDVSNAVERLTDIRHESPQAIVIESSKPTWSASHRAITSEALRSATHN